MTWVELRKALAELPAMDHALARLDRGAWGVLMVEGQADPSIYDGVIESGHGH